MARKAKAKFEKLHVLTWMITPAIMCGIYLFAAVIVEMNKIQLPFFSKEYFAIITTACPGIAPCIPGAFIGLGYGILAGAILGGLFAFLHNAVRKLFK